MHSLYVDEEGISFAIRPHSCLKLPIIRWSNAASPLMTTVQQSALVSDFNCWFVLSTQPLADRHIAWTQSRRYGIMGRLSAAVHRSPLSALPQAMDRVRDRSRPTWYAPTVPSIERLRQ